jgi:hypothetical protein
VPYREWPLVKLIIFKALNYIVVLSRLCSMVVDKFHVLIFVVSVSGMFFIIVPWEDVILICTT